MITKIISGGQTGADQGGLYAAKELGIETGGTMPKHFMTQKGPQPELAKAFNLAEHFSSAYRPRTMQNICDSDGTLIFGNVRSSGSKLTLELCMLRKKPFRIVIWNRLMPDYNINIEPFKYWIINKDIKILNVAGNREEINPGIFYAVKSFLILALQK